MFCWTFLFKHLLGSNRLRCISHIRHFQVDLEEEWTVPDTGGQSRAGWTPYGRKKLRGRVKTVVLRGEVSSDRLICPFFQLVGASLLHDVNI